jgi:hypothetical protein
VQGWHICRPAPLEEFLAIGLDNMKAPVT